MLASMRSGAGNVFAKILLGLLVLSFALWGIEDIFRSSHSNTIAKVDGTPLSLSEFQQQLNRETLQYRRMLGSNYTPELLAGMGIPKQILDGMVARELMQKETARLRLNVDDRNAFAAIRGNSMFQSESGNFDKRIFQANIDAMGMTQRSFIDQTRREEAGRLILGTLLDNAAPPSILMDRIRAQENETRDVTLLTISPVISGDAPTDTELQNYYEEHGKDFTRPETRILSYLVLDPGTLGASVKIDEAEAEQLAQARKEELTGEEKRTLDHLLFASENEAKAAYEQLKKGTSFTALASLNIKNKGNTALGTLSESEVPENAGATVFALKEKAFSAPYESGFGWHIFYVRKIESVKTPDSAELLAQARAELRQRKIEESLPETISRLEDALASGATLEEAAQTINVAVSKIGPVEAENKTLVSSAILAAGFGLNEKEVSSVIPSEDGRHYIVRADHINQAALKPITEIHSALLKAWQKETAALRLEKKTKTILEALQAGKSPTVVASTDGVTLANQTSLTRNVAKNLPTSLQREVFATSISKTTTAYKNEAGAYMIAVVTGIEQGIAKPAVDAKEAEKFASIYARELAGQYLAHLHALYPVQIDNEALTRVSATHE